jgi:hypothetical protein
MISVWVYRTASWCTRWWAVCRHPTSLPSTTRPLSSLSEITSGIRTSTPDMRWVPTQPWLTACFHQSHDASACTNSVTMEYSVSCACWLVQWRCCILCTCREAVVYPSSIIMIMRRKGFSIRATLLKRTWGAKKKVLSCCGIKFFVGHCHTYVQGVGKGKITL